MKVISISGIISRWVWEGEENVSPNSLKKALEEAGGEDVRIDINSPGGDVYAGFEMYNLIKNYSGHTETRVVALAASMGSIIALAGDSMTAESTAVYMIHNPWCCACGDYREVTETATWLKRIADHSASLYTKKTGIEMSEIREMMDSETWLFGEELKTFGFSLIDTESDSPIVSEMAIKDSKMRYENLVKGMQTHQEEMKGSIQQVAALLPATQTKMIKKTTACAGEKETKEGDILKNIHELQAQYPDLYDQVLQAGVKKERQRVVAHINMGEGSKSLDLSVKNIREGKEFDDEVRSEYFLEANKALHSLNREDDNPEPTPTESSKDHEYDDNETKNYTDNLLSGMRGRKKK